MYVLSMLAWHQEHFVLDDPLIYVYFLLVFFSYSVMQSDGNSFCGDVVSDSFNKASGDEDNILDQIYKSKYVRIIIMMILILYNIYENAY